MKESHRASLALIVSDYGQEDAIRHVEVVVVLRLAGHENIRTRRCGVAPKERAAATAEGHAPHWPIAERGVAHAGHMEHALQVMQEVRLTHRLR